MGLGIIGWLVIGIVAGWLAEKVMGRNHGLLTNLIVGVIGALIGGFISANVYGTPVGGFNFVTLIVAFLGACLLLFLLGLVKRRALSGNRLKTEKGGSKEPPFLLGDFALPLQANERAVGTRPPFVIQP